MDFGKLLTRAWEIVWKNKILWLFGFLANCGGQTQSFGNRGFNNSGLSYQSDPSDFNNLPFDLERYTRQLERTLSKIPEESIPLIFFGLICLVLLLMVVSFVLSTIGRTGLVTGTLQVEAGAESLSIGGVFEASVPFLVRALLLNLLIAIVAIVITIPIIILVIALTALTLGFGLLCLIPLICLAVPIGWLVRVIIEQANIALIVEDLNIFEAFERGWTVFRDNLSTMVIMGLILILGGAIISFIISIPVVIAIAPVFAAMFGTAVTGSGDFLASGLAIAGICLVIYIPFYLVLESIKKSFIQTSWTLTFIKLSGSTPSADIPEKLPAAT